MTATAIPLIIDGVIPLSWAQRSWLAGPPLLDENDAWLHEVATPLRVPAGFAPDQAVTILRRLVRSYPSLRSRMLRLPDGTIAQEVLDPDDPAPSDGVRQRVTVRDPDGGETSSRERRIGTDVPNIALELPPRGSSDTVATISLAHSFVDGGGLDALLSAFHRTVRSGEPPAAQDLLFRRIAFEQSAAGAAVSAAAVQHLVRTAGAAVGRGLADPQRPVVKGDRPAGMVSSPALFQLLAGLGAGSRLMRASLLLSVATLAYCAMRDRTGVWAAVAVANRMSADDRAFVGITVQNSRMLHVVAPGARFADMVRAVAGGFVECARHGRFDPGAADRALDGAGLPRMPNLSFNYVEPPDISWRTAPEPATGAELDLRSRRLRWERQQVAGGSCPVEVNAFAAARSVGLILKYDDTVFTRADIGRFVDALRSVTGAVVRDPHVPVAGLLAPV